MVITNVYRSGRESDYFTNLNSTPYSHLSNSLTGSDSFQHLNHQHFPEYKH